jgi:hypothetical protein
LAQNASANATGDAARAKCRGNARVDRHAAPRPSSHRSLDTLRGYVRRVELDRK